MILREVKSAIGRTLRTTADAIQWARFRHCCPLVRSASEQLPATQCLYSIYISERYHYVYIDNPKTGCSSLKSALVELELAGTKSALDCYDVNVVHDRAHSPLKRLTDMHWSAPLTALMKEGYRFITFVRNPYTRLLSCYRSKILGNKPQKGRILLQLGIAPEELDRSVSFEEFVRVVVGQSDWDMDPHWRVQSTHILFGIVPYSFIGRFERYQADFEALFSHLGIPSTSVPTMRHLNRTKEGQKEDCYPYYTETLRSLVHDRYKEDFSHFGYSDVLPN